MLNFPAVCDKGGVFCRRKCHPRPSKVARKVQTCRTWRSVIKEQRDGVRLVEDRDIRGRSTRRPVLAPQRFGRGRRDRASAHQFYSLCGSIGGGSETVPYPQTSRFLTSHEGVSVARGCPARYQSPSSFCFPGYISDFWHFDEKRTVPCTKATTHREGIEVINKTIGQLIRRSMLMRYRA